MSVFEGHTIFSLFGNDEKLHVHLYNQLSEADWPEAEQEDEYMMQNSTLRRLYRILNLPTPDIAIGGKKDRSDKNMMASINTSADLNKSKDDPLNKSVVHVKR